MNRVFNNFRPGSGKSFRIVLRVGACHLVVACGLALMIVARRLACAEPPNVTAKWSEDT